MALWTQGQNGPGFRDGEGAGPRRGVDGSWGRAGGGAFPGFRSSLGGIRRTVFCVRLGAVVLGEGRSPKSEMGSSRGGCWLVPGLKGAGIEARRWRGKGMGWSRVGC